MTRSRDDEVPRWRPQVCPESRGVPPRRLSSKPVAGAGARGGWWGRCRGGGTRMGPARPDVRGAVAARRRAAGADPPHGDRSGPAEVVAGRPLAARPRCDGPHRQPLCRLGTAGGRPHAGGRGAPAGAWRRRWMRQPQHGGPRRQAGPARKVASCLPCTRGQTTGRRAGSPSRCAAGMEHARAVWRASAARACGSTPAYRRCRCAGG